MDQMYRNTGTGTGCSLTKCRGTLEHRCRSNWQLVQSPADGRHLTLTMMHFCCYCPNTEQGQRYIRIHSALHDHWNIHKLHKDTRCIWRSTTTHNIHGWIEPLHSCVCKVQMTRSKRKICRIESLQDCANNTCSARKILGIETLHDCVPSSWHFMLEPHREPSFTPPPSSLPTTTQTSLYPHCHHHML